MMDWRYVREPEQKQEVLVQLKPFGAFYTAKYEGFYFKVVKPDTDETYDVVNVWKWVPLDDVM